MKTLNLTDRLYEYLLSVSLRDSEILAQLRSETAALTGGGMQISADQGAFMALLVQLMGAKKTLEIGVFTGYSSLAVALALPPEGKIIACDVSPHHAAIAQRYWEKAGVASKIDFRLAPALETLDKLLAAGEVGTFDFVFIDADKRNYDSYYERSLQLTRTGGLIAIDNVLWGGSVVDSQVQDPDTVAIRNLNAKLHKDDRITLSLVPIADGLTLALKR